MSDNRYSSSSSSSQMIMEEGFVEALAALVGGGAGQICIKPKGVESRQKMTALLPYHASRALTQQRANRG